MDPTLRLLFIVTASFTAVLIFVEYRFQTDAQVFQVVASLVVLVLWRVLRAHQPAIRRRISARRRRPCLRLR